MLVEIARLLLDLVFSLFGALLLLRVWMQATQLPPRNPLSQGVFQFTNWMVLPLRRIVPGVGLGPDMFGPPAPAMLLPLRRKRVPPAGEQASAPVPQGPFAALAALKR
ncbi:MAG: YggT family protein [Rhodospirillales bacterium]|nr:YggT family protein [Rhodospirillales bacterium]